MQFLISARAAPLTRTQQAQIHRKLDQVLKRSGPYVIGLLGISGAVAKEHAVYALVEGLLREIFRSMGWRPQRSDAIDEILRYLERQLRPSRALLNNTCYAATREALTGYITSLIPERVIHVQDALAAWGQTNDARKQVTYALSVETMTRRYRKAPPKRATARLLDDLQQEYRNSSALFELRLRLLLSIDSDNTWTHWTRQGLSKLLDRADENEHLRIIAARLQRHVRNALAHGWAVPDLKSNKYVFHDRNQTVTWSAGEFYEQTRCLTMTAHALMEFESLFTLVSTRQIVHGLWRYLESIPQQPDSIEAQT